MTKTPSVKKAALPPQKAAPTRAPHQTDVLAGIRVRLRRKELGLSQSDLANRLGFTCIPARTSALSGVELQPGFTTHGLCASFDIHPSLAVPLAKRSQWAGLPASPGQG